jgi:hypothetical protein
MLVSGSHLRSSATWAALHGGMSGRVKFSAVLKRLGARDGTAIGNINKRSKIFQEFKTHLTDWLLLRYLHL